MKMLLLWAILLMIAITLITIFLNVCGVTDSEGDKIEED